MEIYTDITTPDNVIRSNAVLFSNFMAYIFNPNLPTLSILKLVNFACLTKQNLIFCGIFWCREVKITPNIVNGLLNLLLKSTMQKNIQSTVEQLTPIFQDVFDDDELTITESTAAKDVEGWDSLAHIRLVVSIEKAFGLRFTADEISNLENIGALAELILKKQANA